MISRINFSEFGKKNWKSSGKDEYLQLEKDSPSSFQSLICGGIATLNAAKRNSIVSRGSSFFFFK